MELCHVQFRKSRLEKKQEQTAKAKDKAKTKIMAEADAEATRDNAPIQYCKFCNLEVLFKKNTDGKQSQYDYRSISIIPQYAEISNPYLHNSKSTLTTWHALRFTLRTKLQSRGIRTILKEHWNVYQSDDNSINWLQRISALKLAKECNEVIFNLVEEGPSVMYLQLQ